jgi:hypothetical protein
MIIVVKVNNQMKVGRFDVQRIRIKRGVGDMVTV